MIVNKYLKYFNVNKQHLIFLCFLVCVSAILEIGMISLIYPIILITNSYIIGDENEYVVKISQVMELSTLEFLKFSYLFAIILLILSAIIIIAIKYKTTLESSKIGTQISASLLKQLYKLNHLDFNKINRSELISLLTIENNRLTNQVIIPFMNMISGCSILIIIVIFSIILQPEITIMSMVFFALFYLVIYFFLKKRLEERGSILSEVNTNRLETINFSLGMFDNVKLNDCDNIFVEKLQRQNKNYYITNAFLKLYTMLPKYLIEYSIFLFILVFFFFQLSENKGGENDVVEIIVLFALLGIKLLPTLHQVFVSFTTIKSNIVVLNNYERYFERTYLNNNMKKISFQNLNLKDLSFDFHGVKIFDDLNVNISKDKKYVLHGKSGSGKSTLVKLFLGLVNEKCENLFINGLNNQSFLIDNSIFISQNDVIFPGTISENIAFMTPNDEIDLSRISDILTDLGLDGTFIHNGKLNDLDVSNQSIQLSGGQKQRVCVARAMYYNFDFVVLDEPTSALDIETSQLMINSIFKYLSDKTLIIITHDNDLFLNFDEYLSVEHGKVVNV